MDYTLTHLIDSLQSTLKILKGPAKGQLLATLHDHNKLPDKRLAGLASTAIDLLYETEQLLEPGSLVLADHFLGYLNSKCLTAAVELNVPDILRHGPKPVSELAIEANANEHRLRQVLRVLHNDGIFVYDASTDTYSNNSTSILLLSDHWTQWRNWVDLYGNEFYDMARGIPTSCRKDVTRIAGQVNFNTDTDMFTYFTEQGWLPRLHKTLSGGAEAQAPGILEDYPWEEISDGCFLDVGGGGGGLVALLLRKHQNMRAGILDTAKVIEHATRNFHEPKAIYADVGSRVPKENIIIGDFLIEIPSFEVYTMKWCLHDWDDSKALKVMSNIRSSIIRGPKSRLIILEALLNEGRMGRLARYGDLTMAISANGQERTEAQWRSLAAHTGWEVRNIFPMRNAWVCAIELVPAWNDDKPIINGVADTFSANKPGDSEPEKPKTNSINGDHPTNGTNVIAAVQEGLLKSTEIGVKRIDIKIKSEVQTIMSFLEPWSSLKGEPFFRSAPDEGFQSKNFDWVDELVTVHDARLHPNGIQDFTLDKNGFCFEKDPDTMTPELVGALRIGVKETVQTLYYPKVEELVKRLTGGKRVIIFDHTVRKRDPEMIKGENPNGKEQPATVVHCDQSRKGALRRVKQNIGPEEDIDVLIRGRIRMLNVWRPLIGPVQDWPLAMMDFRTLSAANVHPCDLWRNQYEERGQTVTFEKSDTQKWWFLGGHEVDEVTILKIWDSKNEDGCANMCSHAAFQHPDTPAGTPPRESVEVRCIVLDE